MASSRIDALREHPRRGIMLGQEGDIMLGKIGSVAFSAMALASPSPQADDPLTRPINVSRAAEWLAPREPERLFGNSYLVGFGGLSVVLIDTGAGLILIDGAMPQAAPAILANVAKLGFRARDIKFILSTEPHFDHAGGLAALSRDTGATVVASDRGVEALRTGRLAQDDPQLAYDSRFPGVTKLRAVSNGEVLKLGNTAITAVATPGHTMGSMSWSWRSCAAPGQCRNIVYASSLNPVSADGYRFSARANRAIPAAFARSWRAMERVPCDILIAAHPDNAGEGRYNATPGACAAYVDRSRKALATRLADERAGKVK